MDRQDETVQVRIEGVGRGPEVALQEVLGEFADHAYNYSATAWVPFTEGSGGRALAFRLPGRELHVVGTSKLAETFRTLLREGALPGWTLHEVPAERTLLEVAEPTLGHRVYKLLSREGFSTLEELAAAPDEGLTELRNLGAKALDAIHQAVATYTNAPVVRPSEADEQARRRDHIDAVLSPAHQLRNAELLDLLARSSVPMEAVDAILASLGAEPVPPADPMVSLLLATAGEPTLAALYGRARTDAVIGVDPAGATSTGR
ncbi:MAG: hypothetical protein M3R63_18435 [Actinomycetota bacterium]|nr:hypothetical protein [Actinomycetota bacterium]